MNLQTERIENHKAQFTIEIETEQLDEAKRRAARKISREVRIKGFRKGKAPYRLVAQYVGEGAILEEALEALGDNLYKRALEESEIVPYGPGAFEDFSLEPTPTFTFSVPLQPEVDLKDYLDVRLEFEAPTVSDEQLDEALRQLQLNALEVVDEDVRLTAPGHRVTIAVDSEFIDGDAQEDASEIAPRATEDEPPAADSEETESQAADETVPVVPKKGDTFVKDDNTVIILDPNEDPFVHGFVEHLIDVEIGSDVEFELTIPDDDADDGIAGRQVSFLVTIKGAEEIAIPELDDDFARRASRSRGDEEQDLDGFRAMIEADLERTQLDQAKSEYTELVLAEIVDGAVIEFPDMMLDEQTDGMIRDFEANLQQRGVKLEDYLRMTNTSDADLREQYRDPATSSLRQSLVLRELVSAQAIEISDDDIEARLEHVIAGYGTSDAIRKLFDTPQMKGNIRNELMMSYVDAHLFAIGRGAAPEAEIEALKGRMAADAERARERNERVQRYAAEEEAQDETDEDDAPAVNAAAEDRLDLESGAENDDDHNATTAQARNE